MDKRYWLLLAAMLAVVLIALYLMAAANDTPAPVEKSAPGGYAPGSMMNNGTMMNATYRNMMNNSSGMMNRTYEDMMDNGSMMNGSARTTMMNRTPSSRQNFSVR